ncbi:CtsR family transcriptional regulator [Tepidibacter formicigenes]|jgi:transcriptional regulator CtsR|uniref:Transcriptional regulator CtsR n=1 Tax=Tepidibacter formicigenes DSM 15518 TaxID=1123349 RepID=A0A1M6QM84_9FIRM|nr:CtsR family transcriptional regulator [Tepidibacter formicigenes]SHK21326.1 transcriptional regulator CtsR [Tepidibacter formicigenes DSM 15518]
MPSISDIIENFIKELLKESKDVEIRRNELASFFNCAPSQINYVLTTRFNMDKGYYIESKKGGGGYIKIIKIDLDRNKYLKNIIYEKIKDNISFNSSKKLISNLRQLEIITPKEEKIILAAIDDKSINPPVRDLNDKIRANILKNILMSILGYF